MNEIYLVCKFVSLLLAFFFGLPWIGMLVRGHPIAAMQTFAVSFGIQTKAQR